MALDAVRALLGAARGSLVAYEADARAQLDAVSFQAPRMREAFLRGAEAVLVLRCAAGGRALYAFVAVGPGPGPRADMGCVAHLAVPARESAAGLARMCRAFQAFNPEWRRIRAFLVEPRSRLPPALAAAFPAARVRLSAFHVRQHLQHKVRQAALESHAERLVLDALRSATCAPSESNRRATLAVLSAFLPPGVLSAAHRDWLLDEEIWAPHCERPWGESSQYFGDLEALAATLGQVFCAGPSLDSCITSIAQTYQESVSSDSRESPPCPGALLSESASCSVGVRVRSASTVQSQRPLLPRDLSSTRPPALLESKPEAEPNQAACTAYMVQEAATTAAEAAEHIKQSLRDICTEPVARLCLNELAVVQSSVQLMVTHEDTVHVQILEDVQTVSRKGLDSCTCHFSQAFQLPCRHVLAVLNAEGKDLEPERIPAQWRKGYSASQPRQSGVNGEMEVLRSSWDESLDKYLDVSFLTEQISQLLSQCSHEEFDRRYCTLRELADTWIGPYVQVKL